MKILWKWMRGMLVAVVLLVLAGIAVLWIRNRPLASAHDHAFVKTSFERLPRTSVCWVEFDHNVVPGQLATAGLTEMKDWEITASGLLIRHPRGTILVDTGNSSHFQEEIAGYPFWSHLHFEILTGGESAARPATDVLVASGIDPSTLSHIVPSHIHMDHAGGLVDIPNVPVLLAQDEINFMERNRDTKTIQVVPAHARTIEGRVHPINFDRKPYESFDESADLYGDGSVVVVKLPGHTPGSVGTFVNVSPSLRIFHVGDAVNVTEAVARRLPKSFLMETTDNDVHQADFTVAKLYQLHLLDPDLIIVPAHDRAAWKRVFGPSPRCIP
jgi:glyoxylase-like metal-dependent hydrolase (beta-lactamase superfamily II)